MDLIVALLIVLASGAVGACVSLFIGDAGFHLPKLKADVWRAGWIGTVFVGAMAAFTSWATLRSAVVLSAGMSPLEFTLGDIANALLTGFGGSKWWKSETEKDALQKTASIAAAKPPDLNAAARIAASSPFHALDVAESMRP